NPNEVDRFLARRSSPTDLTPRSIPESDPGHDGEMSPGHPPRTPHRSSSYTFHAGNVAMRAVAGIILSLHVVPLFMTETCLPIPLIHFGVTDRDDIFELVASLADAFKGRHFVAVGQAARIQESRRVEAS